MIGSPISESGVKTKSSKMPPMVLGERSFGAGRGGSLVNLILFASQGCNC